MLLFRRLVLLSPIFIASVTFAEVTAGVIIPLSGPGATYGIGCRNGVLLALEELKDKINGRFKIVFEDDQNSPTRTISSLRKLNAVSKTEFVLTFASNTSNALSPLADRENFIHFALATDPLVVKGKKNAFNYWVTPSEEAKTLVAELKRRNIKRIAVYTAQQDGTLAMGSEFLKVSKESGLEVVTNQEVPPDSRDFRSLLAKLALIKNLDGIFNNLYIEQGGIFARQARDRGFTIPIFNIELYEDPALVESAQGALEGQFYINAPTGEKNFSKRYFAKFPKDNLFTASNCYDFVGLLASSPELTVDGFRKYLENLKDYPGASGKSSATGDHRFTLPAVVKEIRGKEFIELER